MVFRPHSRQAGRYLASLDIEVNVVDGQRATECLTKPRTRSNGAPWRVAEDPAASNIEGSRNVDR